MAGVRDALDALDPDAVVINSYSAPDAQAALLWCRQHRRVAVCLMESTAADAPRTAPREWIKRQLIDAFDAALAGGSAQRDYLNQLGFPLDKVSFTCDAVDKRPFSGRARRRPAGTRATTCQGSATRRRSS